MEDKVKTKEQLMSEMAGLRQRIAELESIVSTHESGEESFLSAQMTWVQVFQAIGQAALILDPQHGVIAANHAAEKATGCSEEEMRHKKCYEIFHGTGKPPDECPLQKMLISGHWETAEMEIELLGGIFLVSCTPVLDDAGNLESVIHVATDITESKQAEEALRESEERSRALFKSVPVPTYTWQKVGADFVLVDYNDTAYAITQGAVGDLVGAKASDMYLDAPEIQKELSQCLSEKKLIGRQVPYKYRFSGQQRYLDVKYSFVPPDFVLVHTEDITERRQAEQLLAESEEQFRTITEESLQGIIILQDGMVKYVNEAFANVVGYTPEEMLKWGPNEFEKAVYPEDRAFAIEQARRKQAGEPDVVPHYEYRLFTRTGKTKWVEQYSKTIEYGGRAADLATIIDVTERKRAEEALAINEARFRELFARMSSGVAVYEAIENGTDFVFRDFNQAGERMERVKKEDILGKKVTEAFPGIKEFGLFEVLQRVWKTGDPEYHPVSFYHDQRLTSWRENHVYRLPSGEIVAVYDDITFRKQAEEALQESEERYRSFVQNFPGIAYRSRMDFIPIFFHGAVEKVTGYAEKDFLEGKPRWDQIIHSADLARLFTEDEGKLHSILHYSYEREYRIIRKDGAIRWVQEVIQSAGGDSEGPAFVQGTIIDITERKLAEEALRESEEKYRVLFDSLVMGTFLNSLDGIISNVNKVGSLILGYDRPEDMVGKNIIDFYKKSEDRERLVADVRGKGTASFEVEMVRQDGATIVCRIASAIVTILGNEFLLTSVQDITDHHRTEEALRKSEEHFRTVAQTANDAIVSIDANTNIFFWNHAAEVIFGYSADEMLGKSLAYIIPAQFHDSFYNSFSNWDSSNMAMQLSKAPGRVIEMSGTRKDGTEFPAELSISEWYIEESRFFTTIVRDITERKKAEGALRESEANFRGIAERSFDGIITINREQQFVYVSPAITRIHGYQPEEMLHRTFWDFLPESELPHVQEAFRKVLNGFNVEALELQVISKDGTIITIEINASPIVVDGNTIGLQCIYRDITERKRTEEELRKEKEFSESLIDTAGALILGFSADGVITLFNKQSELTTGWKRGEVLGRNWLDTFVSESHKTLVGGNFLRALRGESAVTTMEYPIFNKDGEERLIYWNSIFLRDEEGRVTMMVAVGIDVTERKRAEDELARHRDQLEEMVEERTSELTQAQEQLLRQERLATLGQFSGSISHELRNPLGVIGSSAYYLRTVLKNADKKTLQHLDRIKTSVDNSSNIIESLLNLTRMGDPRLKRIGLVAFLTDTMNSFGAPPQIDIIRNFPEQEIWINADEEQLGMAVKNIINNAFETMENEGTLTVTVSTRDKDLVELNFTDTGQGIAAKNLESVFQPLFSTKAKGIGFGLAIVKMVIDKHSGSIEAQSEYGKGATIAIKLPVIPT